MARRDSVLGRNWGTSTDQAWTTSGDATGFHILTAQKRDGYAWNTIATLSEPGVDTTQWTGNACVTGSGRYLVAAYAPEKFGNTQSLFDRGAFTAIVNLRTGQVTKLAINATLAYFDPGCGTGDQVVITQSDNESSAAQTRLQVLDAADGKVTSTVTVDGQITSAVPSAAGIVAADGIHLVRISTSGKTTVLATTKGAAFRLHPDGSSSSSGVTFLDTDGKTETLHQLSGKTVTALAHGTLGQIGLSSGTGGHVYITGNAHPTAALPADVSTVAAPAGAQMSSQGNLAVVSTAPQNLAQADPQSSATEALTRGSSTAKASGPATSGPTPRVATGEPAKTGTAAAPSETAQTVVINAVATSTGTKVDFNASPTVSAPATDAATGGAPSPILPFVSSGSSAVSTAKPKADTVKASAADSPTDPVDEDHTCAVARNDASTMVYQPTPNQVEWAVDLAVRGDLTSANISRPANWKDSGLPAWSPQTMFPLPALVGGGQIPPQVLLGILTQESNLWQASSHAEPGEYGNPLVGNYYGTNIYPGTTGYDPNLIWKIDWSNADCGYGIGQVTDGMRLPADPKPGETELPADEQRALAMDYATNIAYSAQILAEKWNELQTVSPAITMNNDDPSKIENWFAAVWDYNEGFNAPGSDPSGAYGLGWYNNPANPIYPADRGPFLDGNITCPTSGPPGSGYVACEGNTDLTDGPTYADAAQPQNWPYEEKVMGWAAAPIDTGRSYDDNGNENTGNPAGYSAAWWNSDYDRVNVKPPLDAFCNANNGCDVSNPPACETEHLANCDDLYWYTQPVVWKSDCSTSCGNAYMTYLTLRAEPGDAHPAPINCGPVGSTVIGSVSADVAEPACPGGEDWTDGGTFSFSFPEASDGTYEAKEDLQQISSGFGGHYWFSHGREPNNWDNLMETTGTWTPNNLPTHLYQIQVHMPYLGNMTKTAIYQITTADGTVYDRTVDQSSTPQGWIILGYFNLAANAKVVLTNVTNDGSSGDTTVAYDAMMFTPWAGTWVHHTFDAASIFSSDQNMDTNTPWLANTPMRTSTTLYDWAHSVTAGGEKFDNSGTLVGLENFATCTGGNDTSSCIGPNLKTAVDEWGTQVTAAGTTSPADWMGFSNAVPPATIDPNNSFQDDLSYKIKSHIDVQWVTGPDGQIIPGSQNVTYSSRTGSTHIADFVQNFVQATVADYGSHGVTMPDLSFTAVNPNAYGTTATVSNPLTTGSTPGQAYQPASQAVTIDSSGTCLDTKMISGGTIGLRLLDAQSNTDAAMSNWVNQLTTLSSAGFVPTEVSDAAGDIYSMFFRAVDATELEGSLFNMAPPIWQNISMAFCTDGTVKSTQAAPDLDDTPSTGLVYQSYMPDLYLYLDGHQVDENGNPTTGPVQKGNFANFSNIPDGLNSTPYGPCATGNYGNGGNPWSLSALGDIGVNDPGAPGYCDMTIPPTGGV